MLCRGISDRNAAFPPPPDPDAGVHEPSLWRCTILCHQPVRGLRERSALLSTRAILFLAILFFHELHLDCGSLLYVLIYQK